jgi:tyrosine decarboxylase / aspartate 1-decarboxylase
MEKKSAAEERAATKPGSALQLESPSIAILAEALQNMASGFAGLPALEDKYDYARIRKVILQAAERMQDNYPYFHPYYAGQMLKPPHPVAQIAYMLSLWLNPNNHAIDGGRASSRMEKEAVAELAKMFGWSAHLGHLTSGGTMANLEALWISGQLHPGKLIVASELAHYTHSRISDVLKLPFQEVTCNAQAQMDLDALENLLKTGRVGTVVATVGSTGTGSIDPVPEILKLKAKYGFRLHIDAAYGGYFILVDNLSPASRRAYASLTQADSIVIDPHKHGLQPYGCGCILFKDPAVGRFYKHDSPYTYFSSQELHLGEISLECSRPGAAAVALWATQQLLPMVPGGEFAGDLARSRSVALDLYRMLAQDSRCRPLIKPELDIVTWAPLAPSTRQISAASEAIFTAAATLNLHLATFRYPTRLLSPDWQDVQIDSGYVLCLRSCLMKPSHQEWLDRIWQILDQATNNVLGVQRPKTKRAKSYKTG